MSGFSLESLSAGQVLGFLAHPRTTDDFDTEKHLPNPSTNTSYYHISQAWETTITNASSTYHAVKQPTNANRVQTLLLVNQLDNHLKPLKTNHLIKFLKADSHLKFLFLALPTLNVSIPVTMYHHFSSWHFTKNLSQCSIQGRSRNNACTLIALTIAKLFCMAVMEL